MGKERAMVAAATLQRDAGVMLSNLQILSQSAMALNRMSFSMMALGLDRSVFPGAEVEALSPAPRARRAAPYMSAMGLWLPQENPTAPRPAPTPSCNLCRKVLLPGQSVTSGVKIFRRTHARTYSDFITKLMGSGTQLVGLALAYYCPVGNSGR